MTLRCISLWQPFASLIAIGAKRVETRNWSTAYRGEIAIHAAKRWTTEEQLIAHTSPFRGALVEGLGLSHPDYIDVFIPLGAIVAVARLVGVLPTNDICIFGGQLTSGPYVHEDGYFPCGVHEADFGDFSPGRYAWLLSDIRRLPTPVPCKGAQQIWTAPPEVEAKVRAQLTEANR